MGMTICVQCKRHIFRGKDDPEEGTWYDHFCGASLAERWIDPVTGKEGPKHGYSDYLFCREVNKDGECPKFRKKLFG